MTTVTEKSCGITLTDKFCQVYADAVKNHTDKEAREKRQLYWHGPRVSLAEAAKLYALIEDGYNNFEPDMLAKLLAEFPDGGIEVTPAREGSPVVYLHIPRSVILKHVEAFIKTSFDADEVDIVDHFTCLQEGETELVGKALRVWWD